MRKEMTGGDMRCQLTEILVIPRRLDAPEHPGRRRVVIPAYAESVAVGRLGTERRVQALVDQRMRGRVKRPLQQYRRTAVSKPSTHIGSPSSSIGHIGHELS